MTLQDRSLDPVPLFGTGLIHQLLGPSAGWPSDMQRAVKPAVTGQTSGRTNTGARKT